MAATRLEDNATEFDSGFLQTEVTEVIDFRA